MSLSTSSVEQALTNWAVARLGATDTTLGTGENQITVKAATIGGVPLSVHPAFTNEVLPELGSAVIFHCQSVPNTVGGLFRGKASIGIETPINLEGMSDATHRAHVAAVRALFPNIPSLTQRRAEAVSGPEITTAQAALDAANAIITALDTAMTAAANAHCTSFYATSAGDSSIHQSRWRTALSVDLCLRELVS